MLRDLITEKEYIAMDDYRLRYACVNDNCNNRASIRSILGEWERSKENLCKLLDGNLILSRKINYTPAEEEIDKEIKRLVSITSDSEFVSAFYNWCPYNTSCRKLLSCSVIAKNAWLDDTPLIIEMPNGRDLKVIKGTKPLKILGKIAAAYDLPGFEEFRIRHSLIFNKKNMSGNLSISIHPLDYWTMSDNDCNWESCMSWQKEGCFRQGTVEMMNSPMVVVAYLSSERPFELNDDFSWNNKRWRQLFIVNKDIICGIKGYPFQNDYLAQLVIDWIADLAKKNLDWDYAPDMLYYHKCSLYQNEEEKKSDVWFSTEYMYNDFDTIPQHWCRIGSDTDISHLYINYCGLAQCMSCGELNPVFESDGDLTCPDCDPCYYCSCCNTASLYRENFYEVNGEYYCPDCYAENFSSCTRCSAEMGIEDEAFIDMIISYDKIAVEFLRLCPDCFSELKKEAPIYFIPGVKNSYYVYLDQVPKRFLPYRRTPEDYCPCDIDPSELIRID